MKQLVSPNLSVQGKIGYCYSYADSVFGVADNHYCAWDAWIDTKYKHTDALPNISVPVWFSYFGTIDGEYRNWGHVVVYVPGAGFYSSPYNTTTGHAVLSSIAEVERIYGCKYVGWSEDISNLRVGEDMTATEIAEIRAAYLAQVAQAAGVNPDKPINQPEVNQIVANIDAKNKQIADLQKQLGQPTDETTVVKNWFSRLVDKIIFWNK